MNECVLQTLINREWSFNVNVIEAQERDCLKFYNLEKVIQ